MTYILINLLMTSGYALDLAYMSRYLTVAEIGNRRKLDTVGYYRNECRPTIHGRVW